MILYHLFQANFSYSGEHFGYAQCKLHQTMGNIVYPIKYFGRKLPELNRVLFWYTEFMKVVIFVFATAIVLLIGFLLFSNSRSKTIITQNIPTPSPTFSAEKVAIKASFTIITGNITRSFKAEKYHNLSPDAYITADDHTVIQVKKAGITWDDFFKTLPMKLTKECLTTGDGETFCEGKGGSLKFYLNDIETPNLLEIEIKEGDKALIKFSSL